MRDFSECVIVIVIDGAQSSSGCMEELLLFLSRRRGIFVTHDALGAQRRSAVSKGASTLNLLDSSHSQWSSTLPAPHPTEIVFAPNTDSPIRTMATRTCTTLWRFLKVWLSVCGDQCFPYVPHFCVSFIQLLDVDQSQSLLPAQRMSHRTFLMPV